MVVKYRKGGKHKLVINSCPTYSTLLKFGFYNVMIHQSPFQNHRENTTPDFQQNQNKKREREREKPASNTTRHIALDSTRPQLGTFLQQDCSFPQVLLKYPSKGLVHHPWKQNIVPRDHEAGAALPDTHNHPQKGHRSGAFESLAHYAFRPRRLPCQHLKPQLPDMGFSANRQGETF